MGRVVDLALRHRLVVILLALLLIAGGWQAYRRLPIDAFPDVTNVQVTVTDSVSDRLIFPFNVAVFGTVNEYSPFVP